MEQLSEFWNETSVITLIVLGIILFALILGALFVVPQGKWHQLTASDNVNILYISPNEDGVERQKEHPFASRQA